MKIPVYLNISINAVHHYKESDIYIWIQMSISDQMVHAELSKCQIQSHMPLTIWEFLTLLLHLLLCKNCILIFAKTLIFQFTLLMIHTCY